jgi:hypothetical protein
MRSAATLTVAAVLGLLAPQTQSRKIMIFGGKDHRTYLGCINCPRTARDSIFNDRGEYGRCPGAFSDNLFCRGPFKEFGRKGAFQDLSACGSNASNPPVIVDDEGAYYGRFSIGGLFAHQDAVCSSSFSSRFRNKDACDVVEWVCEQ